MAVAEPQRTEAVAPILRPMSYTASVGGEWHHFVDLRALLAKATPARSGGELAGLAARSARERRRPWPTCRSRPS